MFETNLFPNQVCVNLSEICRNIVDTDFGLYAVGHSLYFANAALYLVFAERDYVFRSYFVRVFKLRFYASSRVVDFGFNAFIP